MEKIQEIIQNMPITNWYENKANIFALFLALDARTGMLQEALNTTYKPIISIGEKNYFTVYINPEDNKRIAAMILQKMQEPGWFAQATAQINTRAEQLIACSRSLKEIQYADKTNKKLSELYKEFVERFKAMRIYSSIPTMLEHGTDALTEQLMQKLRAVVPEEKINEVFSILTTPTKKSYLLEEELGRLTIATEIAEGKSLKEMQEKIVAHTKKWNWKEYMFEGTPLTEKDFIVQILQDIQKNPRKQLEEIRAKQEQNRKMQAAIIQEYNLSKELQEFFEAAQEIVYVKYFRKGIFAESYYCVEFLLQAIAQRLGLSLDDVRAMIDYEVCTALEEGLGNKEREEIQQRQHAAGLVSDKGRTHIIAAEHLKPIIQKNVVKEEYQNELRGQVACTGTVSGKVCIINDEKELRKMQEDNILVSIMTNPNMFPAMKIAKGIITDVGGLSCHAAIVARELQIPCIVGTKNATKVLKDGMLVELDSETGTVKIIKE